MMGVHPVEWRGPKLEGLTLDLGDLTPMPTDLTVNNRHSVYSSVQEHVETDSRVDMMPVTDTCHIGGYHGKSAPLPRLPGIPGSENHHHVRGESGVVMTLGRNVCLSSCSGFPGSEKHFPPGEFMVNRIPAGHIHPPPPGVAGSELNHVEGQSGGDSWMVEKNSAFPLHPDIAGPERSRGDLAHLTNIIVKIEKVDPVEATPVRLPLRTMPLPTDLTPVENNDGNSSLISLPTDLILRDCEGVKSPPEPLARPLTIDLSDTESEGSGPCVSTKRDTYESRKPDTKGRGEAEVEGGGSDFWNRECKPCEFRDSDRKNWVHQFPVPDSTTATLLVPKSSHGLSHSPKRNTDGVTSSDGWTARRKPLKRKFSVIDLESIIDLEDEELDFQTTVFPSATEVSSTTRGFPWNGSLVKKSESEETPIGFLKLPFGQSSSSQVPELPDGKQGLQLQQRGAITDVQVISDLAKESDQQYVFDIAHDMDDATMEELMCDDEDDWDRLLPNPKEEVPSWYLAQARGNEESVQRPSSVNSPQFSNLGTDCSRGFEVGRGNANHLLQEPSYLRDLNQQLAFPGQRFGQLVCIGANNPQLGQRRIESALLSVSDFGVPPPIDTADAEESLRRFVQASSARGAFQPPQVAHASMTQQFTASPCALTQHDGASAVLESGLDNVAPSVVERDIVADSGALIVRPREKSVLAAKPEPMEFDVRRGCTVDTVNPVVPGKKEWFESNALGTVSDSRDAITNALKMFEQGRMQMMQEQVSADPNGKRVRADLKVACSMRKNGMWQNEHRPIGECPGVKVGDCFTYRIEMAIIGLHRAVQAGIAVVSAEYCPYKKPVAGSVVIGVNETYKDDKDMGENVIYSGQGGLAVDKSGTYQDQKLVRGNLALANSLELGLPVRLIRGHKLQGTSTGILYSYDGLYKVNAMAYGVGVHKNMVYTFHLQRLPGQPPIHPSSVANLLYPASLMPYPLPLNSQASLPTTSHVPQNGEQDWIEQAASSQGGTTQPSASQTLHYRDGGWTGQFTDCNNISTVQSECGGWTGEYEEKPTLYLLPHSSQQ